MTLLPITERTTYCFHDCGKDICSCKPASNDQLKKSGNRDSTQYKFAKRYGLVFEEIPTKVTFFFETYGNP